jgi:hypothetical protein
MLHNCDPDKGMKDEQAGERESQVRRRRSDVVVVKAVDSGQAIISADALGDEQREGVYFGSAGIE